MKIELRCSTRRFLYSTRRFQCIQFSFFYFFILSLSLFSSSPSHFPPLWPLIPFFTYTYEHIYSFPLSPSLLLPPPLSLYLPSSLCLSRFFAISLSLSCARKNNRPVLNSTFVFHGRVVWKRKWCSRCSE